MKHPTDYLFFNHTCRIYEIGVMECVLNVWQLLKQRDLTARALERRQIWIEQNKAIHLGRSRIAIVTGNNSLTWLYRDKDLLDKERG